MGLGIGLRGCATYVVFEPEPVPSYPEPDVDPKSTKNLGSSTQGHTQAYRAETPLACKRWFGAHRLRASAVSARCACVCLCVCPCGLDPLCADFRPFEAHGGPRETWGLGGSWVTAAAEKNPLATSGEPAGEPRENQRENQREN